MIVHLPEEEPLYEKLHTYMEDINEILVQYNNLRQNYSNTEKQNFENEKLLLIKIEKKFEKIKTESRKILKKLYLKK